MKLPQLSTGGIFIQQQHQQEMSEKCRPPISRNDFQGTETGMTKILVRVKRTREVRGNYDYLLSNKEYLILGYKDTIVL